MDIEARLRRLEDLEEIRQLVTKYGIIMDERDEAGIEEIFSPDAELRSKDGVFSAKGLDNIVETYRGRFAVLGPTYHYVHGQTIDIDPDDPDRATGTTTSHAEVVRNDQSMIAAILYEDVFRRHDGKWKFSEREIGFFYYMPPGEYAKTMLSPDRNLAYGDPRPADYPQALIAGE